MVEFHGAIGLSILVEPPPTVRQKHQQKPPCHPPLAPPTAQPLSCRAQTYVKNNTHRTTVGAVLNGLHIPSTTLELGPANVSTALSPPPLVPRAPVRMCLEADPVVMCRARAVCVCVYVCVCVCVCGAGGRPSSPGRGLAGLLECTLASWLPARPDRAARQHFTRKRQS